MKEPLLLLPGMMCDARLFASQISEFSVDHSVMVPPFTGRSNFVELSKDILAHAPHRFALAGLSMGGIVAMEIVRQAPVRVLRLALMDTNPLAESAVRASERNPQIERVINGGLRSVMRDEMKLHYLTDGPNNAYLLDLCMKMAEALGAEVFAEQSKALQQRPDQCDTLRAIDMPTLILCGEQDALCPVERHQFMSERISESRLAVNSGAGHLPVLEQSALTNKEIKLWLNT
jgi:pimeloyl-ACP methyl ester carboxylesterase